VNNASHTMFPFYTRALIQDTGLRLPLYAVIGNYTENLSIII